MSVNEYVFENKVLQFLGLEYDVEKRENGSYTLTHPEYGTIDIYPKRKRLLIRRKNKWISNAFDWINDNLLKEKFK
ncbi:hypothetical protein [Elizabethkingia anophelis]|uniref:hypothetical protein n=1 Tax=Elizabethkingia anophelis TaxID=1117645 RepID=UPI001372172D|nr:hypothetical protein [Elizabethkingia anophelis]MCT4135067.1 hypothetical protein [Elizabethkingia anophelis]MCT4148183.1 hypothetical protein [Elizabethkingia anophelis]MYZ60776.1 hypothetical protein [Elizabethkingia anophelis]